MGEIKEHIVVILHKHFCIMIFYNISFFSILHHNITPSLCRTNEESTMKQQKIHILTLELVEYNTIKNMESTEVGVMDVD